ncbi:MAG TPA: F0F1 ATP synthase subunit delta [Wenzhouxiangella sp.]
MQNRTTLARPYARAAYAAAKESGQVEQWSGALQFATAAIANDSVTQQIQDPRLTDEVLVDRLMQLGGDYFSEAFGRFLSALAHYDRLLLLPDVYAQFETLRREAEARVYVHVLSAQEVSDEQTKTLTEQLKKRFGRDIDLDVEVDPALIGGAIIRAGDEVIDGSVRGRIERLSREVTL